MVETISSSFPPYELSTTLHQDHEVIEIILIESNKIGRQARENEDLAQLRQAQTACETCPLKGESLSAVGISAQVFCSGVEKRFRYNPPSAHMYHVIQRGGVAGDEIAQAAHCGVKPYSLT